jgi:hypothetical protein
LQTPEKSKIQMTGALEISTSFEFWKPFPEGAFTLTLIEAENLAAMDGGKKGTEGSSDPFAKVIVVHNSFSRALTILCFVPLLIQTPTFSRLFRYSWRIAECSPSHV